MPTRNITRDGHIDQNWYITKHLFRVRLQKFQQNNFYFFTVQKMTANEKRLNYDFKREERMTD